MWQQSIAANVMKESGSWHGTSAEHAAACAHREGPGELERQLHAPAEGIQCHRVQALG